MGNKDFADVVIEKENEYINTRRKKATTSEVEFEAPTCLTVLLARIGYYILIAIGFLNEFLFPSKVVEEKNRTGYESILDSYSPFYLKYVVYRFKDCIQRTICSIAGPELTFRERVFTTNSQYRAVGAEYKCLNLGSYNYLGFAENSGPCAENAIKSIYQYGISTGSTRLQYGTCALHDEVEKLLAEYLGVEDSVIFGMGYATNALTIPTFVSSECLVLSDQQNHASVVFGFKLSKATVKIFKHNDMEHLETLLKEGIYYGQPYQENNNYKPWKKIIIFVEGLYSMEGTICPLPKLIALKKKYKAYLYLDEAHSIGALGKRGRGVVDYYNCNSNDVDMLMGTFTKSFGAAGGYIAGKRELITNLRQHTYASKYSWAVSPPVAAQIMAVLRILMKKDGTSDGRNRIERLSQNTRYFRMRLKQMGLVIYGIDNSPVIPLLTYHYSKFVYLVRRLLQENIAAVGVTYPATTFLKTRIRICLSAGHTKDQLDHVLQVLDKISDEIGLRYSRIPIENTPVAWDDKEI
uniref:serine C-palmitoyltransferase n=1 Tax=Diabrotica virgifera virgifera TaxID=50390 RepID=A0A6P7GBA9_DIAVI